MAELEAIKLLKTRKPTSEAGLEICEAVDMAIKALEKQKAMSVIYPYVEAMDVEDKESLKSQLRDLLLWRVIATQDAGDETVELSLDEAYVIMRLLDNGKPYITTLDGNTVNGSEND